MSDPNDVWKENNGAAAADYARESSPRRETRGEEQPPARSPRRDRSRSPGRGPERGGRSNDPGMQNPGNNLHVSGLSRAVTERQLEDLFSKVGKIAKVQIMMDPHSQESRGFGFVMMETAEEAQAAIDQLTGTNLEGKTMTVAHARRGRARTPTPGRYHGTKADGPGGRPPRYGGGGYDRPYQPRSYDSRYYDRPRGGYDERDRYDRRDRYDDRRYDDRYAAPAPRGDRYDRYDDYYRGSGASAAAPAAAAAPDPYYYRSERDSRYERREERPRYDERPRY